MEAQPVNLGALDALVLDYVESEFLVENPDASTISSASSNVNVRMAIHLIQTLMQSGRIMEAFNLMQEHVPVVLEDQHLLFQLHKQVSSDIFVLCYCPSIQCCPLYYLPCAKTLAHVDKSSVYGWNDCQHEFYPESFVQNGPNLVHYFC